MPPMGDAPKRLSWKNRHAMREFAEPTGHGVENFAGPSTARCGREGGRQRVGNQEPYG
jgi:hypothetical protein